MIGLSIDENNNWAKISYIFDYDYWNNGYCTEVCRLLLDIGFNKLKLDKIFADTVDGNSSSIRVLEKLGFKLEGRRKETAYIKDSNEYKDFLDHSILIEEYKQQTK